MQHWILLYFHHYYFFNQTRAIAFDSSGLTTRLLWYEFNYTKRRKVALSALKEESVHCQTGLWLPWLREMDMWHTVGPICVSVISETPVTKVLLQNELNNHLPLSGFIHQTTSGGLPNTGGYLFALHEQLGAISRLRYLSESETFIILSCQRTYSARSLSASHWFYTAVEMSCRRSTSLHFTYRKPAFPGHIWQILLFETITVSK